jgi:hypothetical protein
VLRPIVKGPGNFDEKQDAARLLDQLTKSPAAADPKASVARPNK